MTNQRISNLVTVIDNLRTDLQHANLIKQADEMLRRALAELGFSDYAYVYYAKSVPNDDSILHTTCSPRMEKWLKFYHDQGFHKMIQSGRRVQTSLEPIIGNVLKWHEEAEDPDFKSVCAAAIDHGITSCAVYTLFSAQGGVAVLSVYHPDLEDIFKQTPYLQLVINQVGLYFHRYSSQLLHLIASETSILTPREKECLTWTAHHKKAEEIAKLIKRSKRTVDFHLSNVNRKLETNNKYEAVAKAAALGLIKA